MPAAGLVRSAEDAIWDSRWVTHSLGGGFRPALDLHLSQYQGATAGLLALFTAFLVPARLDDRLELKLRLFAEGQEPVTCERSTDQHTWVQLFLIFVYPFDSPEWKRMKTAEALALQCLAEVLEKSDAEAAR